MKIKSLPIDQRPREKLVARGVGSLSNSELLAVVLRVGSRGENILDLSNKLFSKYNLKKLSRASVGDLKKLFGVGEAKGCQIVACFELGRRLAVFQEGGRKTIRTASDIAHFFMPELGSLQQEHFLAVYLTTKRQIIRTETLFIGTLNESVVHPREVFQKALEENAAALIVLHNHPSGDPSPSSSDIQLTKELCSAGEILGIPVLDHVIIGDGDYFSFRENDLVL